MTKQNKQVMLTVLVILTLVLTIGLGVLRTNKEPERARITGTVDLSTVETESGEAFQQEQYTDKNLVITFTRSTCPYCDEQALAFDQLHKKNSFEHYYIPVNESARTTKEHFEELQTDYQLLIDPGNHLAKKLQIESVPTTIIKRAGEDQFEAIVGTIGVSGHESTDQEKRPSMNELLKP